MHRHHHLRLLSALALTGLLLSGACTPVSASPDAPCADLRTARACWDARCDDGVCISPRTSPPMAAHFDCSGEPPVCVQRFPRRPDDGEWECVDFDGVVLCRGGEPAAGVVAGPRDAGWLCRGEHPAHCVDLAPDRPELDGRWRCRFEGAREGARVCERSTRPGAGDSCSGAAGGRCPTDMKCVSSVCVPTTAPVPSCWVDGDCGARKRCVRGTCG